MQRQDRRRELRLKRFWRSPKTTSSEDSCGYESPTRTSITIYPQQHSPPSNKPTCSLPLLQVWPSQDSPRGEADGQCFIYPQTTEIDINYRKSSLNDPLQTGCGDSGIESFHTTSPSPINLNSTSNVDISSPIVSPVTTPTCGSPTSSEARRTRRPSSALLHPDHARLFALRRQQRTYDHSFNDDDIINQPVGTASSSTTSSMNSIAGIGLPMEKRLSDPWLHAENKENYQQHQRRASTMTTRYSLFDALDLEYALLRAAARNSIGPYSFSGSLHKLTFTQSLAFPALARGLGTKTRRSYQQNTQRPLNPNESGLNTFAKLVTAVVLVLVSFMVFLIVYKFVKT